MDPLIENHEQQAISHKRSILLIVVSCLIVALLSGAGVYFSLRHKYERELSGVRSEMLLIQGDVSSVQQQKEQLEARINVHEQQRNGQPVYFVSANTPTMLIGTRLTTFDPYTEKQINQDEVDKLEKTKLLDVPAESWIYTGEKSGDRMIFAVRTPVRLVLGVTPEGLEDVTMLTYVYEFNTLSGSIELLFSNLEPGVDGWFPIVQSVDEDYLSFGLHGCLECEPGDPKTFLYSRSEKTGKNIGYVHNFEWLKNGNYRYKEFIIEECPEGELIFGHCTVDPETLPYRQESFNQG